MDDQELTLPKSLPGDLARPGKLAPHCSNVVCLKVPGGFPALSSYPVQLEVVVQPVPGGPTIPRQYDPICCLLIYEAIVGLDSDGRSDVSSLARVDG